MTKVNVQETKTRLSQLLELVESGEEVVITRYGKPIARLVRIGEPAPERKSGTWRDSMRIADDFNDEIETVW